MKQLSFMISILISTYSISSAFIIDKQELKKQVQKITKVDE